MRSNAQTKNNKTEFRKSNSSTSCFSDDTEFLDVPKPVAAHSKKQVKNYKATKYLELQITEEAGQMMDNGRKTPPNANNGTMIRKEPPRRFHQKCKSPAGRRNKSPSVSEKTFDSTSCSGKWSSSDEELSGYNDLSNSYTKTSGSHNGSVNTNSGSERRGRSRRKLKEQSSLNDDEEEDGSTCGDEDFHWVKTEPPSEQRTVSPSSSHFTKDSSVSTNGMPPRPPGSLDRRRRREFPKNRHDRDAKSRSSHSLKEKKHENHHFHHSNDYLHHFGGSQFMLHEHPSMPCLANNGGIMGCSWPSRENLQKQSENMFHSTQDLMQCCNRYPFLTPAAAAMYCHCNYPFNSTSTLTLPHMMNLCGQQQQQGKVWKISPDLCVLCEFD